MSDPNTLRILSIDGGGMRGAFSVQWMQEFVDLWGINPNEIWKYFDVICGTSAGGLQALGYAGGLAPSDLKDFLVTEGQWIFSTSSIIPGIRATTLDKVFTMVFGGDFYPNTNFVSALDGLFGSLTMQNLNTNTLITSFDYTTTSPVLYSNVNFPNSSGANELIQNVSLATAAAPLYFPPATWPVGAGVSNSYLDGALIKNNPALLGYMLGNVIKPNANRTCILSIGSGLGDVGFGVPPIDPPVDEANMSFIFSLIGYLITGTQETDAALLETLDQYSLQNLYTYRANAQLDPTLDTELDNSSPAFISYLQTLASTTFSNDLTNIGNFLGHLVA
jgi:predicted acylesterase/phospholipase RssA